MLVSLSNGGGLRLGQERAVKRKGSRKNNLADFALRYLGEIWSIRLSKLIGIAGYFEAFANEYWPKIA